MVGEGLRAEIRRLHTQEGLSMSALAKRFDLDRKTVRRCLRSTERRPYRHPARVSAPIV